MWILIKGIFRRPTTFRLLVLLSVSGLVGYASLLLYQWLKMEGATAPHLGNNTSDDFCNSYHWFSIRVWILIVFGFNKEI